MNHLQSSIPIYFWDWRPLVSWMRGRRACPCNVSLLARFSGPALVMVAAASSTVFKCKSPVFWGDTLAAANVTVMGSEWVMFLIALVREGEVGFALLVVGNKFFKEPPNKWRGENNLVLTEFGVSLCKPGKHWLQMGYILWRLDMVASVLAGTPIRLVGTLLWKIGSEMLLGIVLVGILWFLIGFEALLPTSVVPFGLGDASLTNNCDGNRRGDEITAFVNSCDIEVWAEGGVPKGGVPMEGVEVEVVGASFFKFAFGSVTLNVWAWYIVEIDWARFGQWNAISRNFKT